MALTPEEWLAKREKRWALAFQLVEEGRAPERTRQAVELVKQGMGIPQIAEELGLGAARVGAVLRDPLGIDDAKRKEKRFGLCEGCGRKTFNAGSTPPRHCAECAPAAHAKWSPEKVIAKMREWHGIYGRPPSTLDWNPASARLHPTLSEEAAERKTKRFEEGDWPWVTTVERYFGSWTAGLTAAGFESNPSGGAGRWEDV